MLEYPQFEAVKKCPKCGGQMYYYEMPLEDDGLYLCLLNFQCFMMEPIELEDDGLYLCFTCDDCDNEVYAYSEKEMQEIFNELEDWNE